MKIIHVASFKDEFYNGIKSVLVELIPEQRYFGHNVWIFNHEKNDKSVIEGETYIKGLIDFVNNIKAILPDIVIFHSLYNLDDVFFSYYLRTRHIPYLVEPHGGTSIENAKKSKVKKRIANILYANKFINHAAGIIYLNKNEASECVFSKLRKDYAVIPNGTNFHGIEGKRKPDVVIRFIFLARIDIIQKGLDLLFPAIEEVNKTRFKDKVEFHFYGKARVPEWEKMFDEFMSKSSKNVFYHGPVDGTEKKRAFLNADIFILTSRYEGMPMAVLEALSYGVPCLLTPQTNMADIIEENRCGWITSLTVKDISNTIITAIDDYINHRESLVNNAQKSARQFEWNVIAENSIKAYSHFVENGNSTI